MKTCAILGLKTLRYSNSLGGPYSRELFKPSPHREFLQCASVIFERYTNIILSLADEFSVKDGFEIYYRIPLWNIQGLHPYINTVVEVCKKTKVCRD